MVFDYALLVIVLVAVLPSFGLLFFGITMFIWPKWAARNVERMWEKAFKRLGWQVLPNLQVAQNKNRGILGRLFRSCYFPHRENLNRRALTLLGLVYCAMGLVGVWVLFVAISTIL